MLHMESLQRISDRYSRLRHRWIALRVLVGIVRGVRCACQATTQLCTQFAKTRVVDPGEVAGRQTASHVGISEDVYECLAWIV